jgi:altronate dehydratase
MNKSPSVLRLHRKDNVAVALRDLQAGEPIEWENSTAIRVLQSVPFAHKVALQAIAAGEPILKYGVKIAFAMRDIGRGEWVHTHNAESCSSPPDAAA